MKLDHSRIYKGEYHMVKKRMKVIFCILMTSPLLLPALLCAQPKTLALKEDRLATISIWPTPKPNLEEHNSHIYSAEINKIKRIKASFNLFTFF